jgi:prepilin-type processing-associated H-X9-DG protein/prepilin-type N-terminal cleavage/methylation domain-containing protein
MMANTRHRLPDSTQTETDVTIPRRRFMLIEPFDPSTRSGTFVTLRVRESFTLIELLVVIAIIAILASLLLPSLQRAREQAKQAVCAGHLRGLGQVMILYVDDYEAFPQAYGSNHHIWYVRLNKVTHDPGIFICPSQEVGAWDGVTTGEAEARFPYSYNWIGTGFSDGRGRALTHYIPSTPDIDWRRLRQIVSPTDMIALTDSDTRSDNPGHGIWDGLCSPYYHVELNPSSYIALLLPGMNHRNSANVLFVDGHVMWHDQLWLRTDYAKKWNYDQGGP